MNRVHLKGSRLRLDVKSYRELHWQVLERDSWRCQICGSMQHLQVHHLQSRSHSGSDIEHNLITLCADCHEHSHRKLGKKILRPISLNVAIRK
jgi:5-methylcytosine-specific restriction endonuclease McrA